MCIEVHLIQIKILEVIISNTNSSNAEYLILLQNSSHYY